MNPPSPIEAARGRHGLAEVARRTGIDVLRASGSVTVRCSFPSHGHPDRSPSLRLYLDDGIFWCFGCGKRGDVVEWVCETEGVDWREAIAILDARRPLHSAWRGQALVAQDAEARALGQASSHSSRVTETARQAEHPDLSRTPQGRVHAALAVAWCYYTYGPLHDRGVAYLAQRGVEIGVLEAHTRRREVGHTPRSRSGLVTVLRAKGFYDSELVDAGLAHRRLGETSVTDFYRQRVLIPIRDGEGRICGLIGRNVGDDRWPKYKNPPRTLAYDKSVNLYQPLPAPIAGPRGQVVVVEGTLDAMAIAVTAVRAGRARQFCPVTQSGRELSRRQLDHVAALHDGAPVLALDGDAAGRDASARIFLAAAKRGLRIEVVSLPEGHDPASLLADSGPAGLSTLLRGTASGQLASGHRARRLARTMQGASLNAATEGAAPAPSGIVIAEI